MGLEQERRESAEADSIMLTPEQEASIDRAMAEARDPEDDEVAIAAEFDVHRRLLLIELKTGQRLAIPQEDLQDIHAVRPEDLADVEIIGPGTALHWEKAMEGVLVRAVACGIYGSKWWMDGLAARRRDRLRRAS